MIEIVERIKTGIPGLDELINGGIPKGASVLVSGGTGTGKTILAMQYIYEGAMNFNEPGLFVSLESGISNLIWNMQSFKWDIKTLQQKNLIHLYNLRIDPTKDPVKQVQSELNLIASIVEEKGIKRLAVDSLSILGVWFEREGELRSVIYAFEEYLKQLKTTSILTSETGADISSFSKFGVEEFVVDGVIALYFIPPNRSVFIRKMRGTKHSKALHPFEITGNGFEINDKDTILWQALK